MTAEELPSDFGIDLALGSAGGTRDGVTAPVGGAAGKKTFRCLVFLTISTE